ncbi:MAG: HlyD family efflux transporter periplasmic adaptor subunit [Calditrichaeota bacterium]|nr:efflux RND transporter periplasmic adaptor subunit [Calditrichota bacterium]RQW06657.1 MAG: HlyD family efflux transporter periplasmic adaptor subunit [Calditrichota bacterium]
MHHKFTFPAIIVLFLFSCSGNSNKPHTFTGIIEGTAVEVPALTGGEILSLFAEIGDTVEKGQLLAVIDTTELKFQKQNLLGVKKEISNQKGIALTQLERAKKDYDYIHEKFERFQSLLKNESVSQQTVDDLRNQLQKAESSVTSARQQVDAIAAKNIQAEAQLQTVLKKMNDATIISPLSGTITDKYYEESEAVPPYSPLMEIIDLTEMWVKIYVSETMLPHIQTGQRVKIKPDGTARELSGSISWISSRAEFTPKTILTPETRTSLVYAVKVIVPNEERILKHGMPVEVIVERIMK